MSSDFNVIVCHFLLFAVCYWQQVCHTVFMIPYPNSHSGGVPDTFTLSILLFTCWCACKHFDNYWTVLCDVCYSEIMWKLPGCFSFHVDKTFVIYRCLCLSCMLYACWNSHFAYMHAQLPSCLILSLLPICREQIWHSCDRALLMYSFKYNQQDATLYNILYCCQCCTCFGRGNRPKQIEHWQ